MSRSNIGSMYAAVFPVNKEINKWTKTWQINKSNSFTYNNNIKFSIIMKDGQIHIYVLQIASASLSRLEKNT